MNEESVLTMIIFALLGVTLAVSYSESGVRGVIEELLTLVVVVIIALGIVKFVEVVSDE